MTPDAKFYFGFDMLREFHCVPYENVFQAARGAKFQASGTLATDGPWCNFDRPNAVFVNSDLGMNSSFLQSKPCNGMTNCRGDF